MAPRACFAAREVAMRILITGAGGFIGGHLVERLSGEHAVWALARRPVARPVPGAQYVFQDLARPLDRAALPSQLDAVIHQAAVIRADESPDDATPFLVNVVGTWRLLKYAHDVGVRTFVHASTGGVYGSRDRPFVEEDPHDPKDLYALTKAQAELAVQAAPGEFHKVVLRYFFPYGMGTPNPIPRYIRQALAGEPIEVLDGNRPRLNPLHVSDAVEATVRALDLGRSEVLNVAGEEPTSFQEIARLAAHRAGRAANLVVVPEHSVIPYYRADVIGDVSRMRSALGFRPRVPLERGLGELVDAIRTS
jgi:nucleoside-diphosphate-sugar epimerase